MIRIITIGFVLIASLIAIAGCGGGSGGSGSTPISLTGVSYTEQSNFANGQLTIGAQVNQGSVVSSVVAQVTGPGGSIIQVPFTDMGNGSYTAVFKAPSNSTYQTKTYTVVVNAKDTDGRTAVSDPYTFQVPGVSQPPDPPTGV
jgi:hypothetical protein